MAARRLIAILIALLIASSVAAALAPRDQGGEETTTDETTTAPEDEEEAEAGGDGALVRERVPADPEDPVQLELEPGDELRLVVEVADPAEVLIADLGQSGFAAPGAPARFDLLLREPDSYRVRAGGEEVAKIAVAEPGRGDHAGAGGDSGRNERGSGD